MSSDDGSPGVQEPSNPLTDIETANAIIQGAHTKLNNMFVQLNQAVAKSQKRLRELRKLANALRRKTAEIARLRRVNCALQAECAKRLKAAQDANRGTSRINQEKRHKDAEIARQDAEIARLAAKLRQSQDNAACLLGQRNAHAENSVYFQNREAERCGEIHMLRNPSAE
jgi:chromosome segregation ATPase